MTRLYINPINNLNHMSQKRVYTFGNGLAEGKADMRNLLGGKGANLAEMNLIGVPVPPGFTITTDVCNEYYEVGKDLLGRLVLILLFVEEEIFLAGIVGPNVLDAKILYPPHLLQAGN